MNYKVEPGLYAVGNPGDSSPVLVSANYKMSFDMLRRALASRDAWILVIDTKGINVWCAAGKGTFNAEEILQRMEASGLRRILSGGHIILPQLSATGVRAYELQKGSGFRVAFGPVRAADLPRFLDNGMKATPEMRRVSFGITDRLVLTPTELVGSLKYLIIALALLFILGGVHWLGFSLPRAWNAVLFGGVAVFGAVLAGNVATPLLLPWIPGRPFSLKGLQVGLVWALVLIGSGWHFGGLRGSPGSAGTAAALLLLPATAAYFALTFTGSSTYTSLSGVRKEVRLALPVIMGSLAVGIGIFILGLILEQGG